MGVVACCLMLLLLLRWVYFMVNCSIEVAANESIDSVWRRFRKSVDRADVLKDYARSREFIAKPQRRAAKSHRARARQARYNASL